MPYVAPNLAPADVYLSGLRTINEMSRAPPGYKNSGQAPVSGIERDAAMVN